MEKTTSSAAQKFKELKQKIKNGVSKYKIKTQKTRDSMKDVVKGFKDTMKGDVSSATTTEKNRIKIGENPNLKNAVDQKAKEITQKKIDDVNKERNRKGMGNLQGEALNTFQKAQMTKATDKIISSAGQMKQFRREERKRDIYNRLNKRGINKIGVNLKSKKVLKSLRKYDGKQQNLQDKFTRQGLSVDKATNLAKKEAGLKFVKKYGSRQSKQELKNKLKNESNLSTSNISSKQLIKNQRKEAFMKSDALKGKLKPGYEDKGLKEIMSNQKREMKKNEIKAQFDLSPKQMIKLGISETNLITKKKYKTLKKEAKRMTKYDESAKGQQMSAIFGNDYRDISIAKAQGRKSEKSDLLKQGIKKLDIKNYNTKGTMTGKKFTKLADNINKIKNKYPNQNVSKILKLKDTKKGLLPTILSRKKRNANANLKIREQLSNISNGNAKRLAENKTRFRYSSKRRDAEQEIKIRKKYKGRNNINKMVELDKLARKRSWGRKTNKSRKAAADFNNLKYLKPPEYNSSTATTTDATTATTTAASTATTTDATTDATTAAATDATTAATTDATTAATTDSKKDKKELEAKAKAIIKKQAKANEKKQKKREKDEEKKEKKEVKALVREQEKERTRF